MRRQIRGVTEYAYFRLYVCIILWPCQPELCTLCTLEFGAIDILHVKTQCPTTFIPLLIYAPRLLSHSQPLPLRLPLRRSRPRNSFRCRPNPIHLVESIIHPVLLPLIWACGDSRQDPFVFREYRLPIVVPHCFTIDRQDAFSLQFG